MPKSEKSKDAASAKEVEGRVVIDANDAAPFYYVNFVEVTNTANDFSLMCTRLPPKLSEERRSLLIKTKELHTEPDVIITFPTAMVPGLIRALTTQKEAYEKKTGSEIQEPGGAKGSK
jgi:hypothetical protein